MPFFQVYLLAFYRMGEKTRKTGGSKGNWGIQGINIAVNILSEISFRGESLFLCPFRVLSLKGTQHHLRDPNQVLSWQRKRRHQLVEELGRQAVAFSLSFAFPEGAPTGLQPVPLPQFNRSPFPSTS